MDECCRLQYERCRQVYNSSPNSASSWSSKIMHEGYHKRFNTDSSSEVIYKGAGDGWGAGRGKVNTTSIITSSSFAQQNSNERVRPHGRAQSMNNNHWLPRNGVKFCALSYRGKGQHGATVSPTYSWKRSSAATNFVQGRGRSRHVQHSSVEESGNY
jgi:hypothetical protein